MSQSGRLALAALAAALIATPAVALHPAVSHLWAAGLARFSFELTHPLILGYLTLALVSLLPAVGFSLVVARGLRGVVHVRSLIRSSRPASEGGLRYRRLPADTVAVFTAGVLRPVTFVTAGAERALRPNELRAALLHEEAHQRRRDVFWRLLLQAVGRALAVVPGAQRLVEQETLRCECEADDYAVRGGASRLALFEAIVAASATSRAPYAVGLTGADTEFRLMRLVDPALPLPARPTAVLVALTAAVTMPAVAAHLATFAASTWAPHLIQ
jgi:Zn-dependent protease with chaperone function